MSLLTKLRDRFGYSELDFIQPDDDSHRAALFSREKAKVALKEAENRKEQIQEVSSSLAALRKRNHFSESIEFAMMRKEKHV